MLSVPLLQLRRLLGGGVGLARSRVREPGQLRVVYTTCVLALGL
jgi:hypothetical protein